jgi:kynurenine 3-monooxygenase
MRKALDDFLYWLMPSFWVPLYNSVSFTHMPYKKCIDNKAWQDQMLSKAIKYGGFVALGASALVAFHVVKSNTFSGLLSELKF